LEWLKVPSLHFAVAPSGAPAGTVRGGTRAVPGALVPGRDAGGIGEGEAIGGTGAGAGGALASPYHVFTPPCEEQAPRSVFAELYVPSAHSAVASAGFTTERARGGGAGFATSPYQVFTPPWEEHAPCSLFALL